MKRRIPFAVGLMLSALAHADTAFTLSSSDISPRAPIANTYVFKGYGCDGDNRSPALAWHGAPAGTQSYALTVYDPDARAGGGWWHWIVVDLPADVASLPTGAGDADASKLPVGSRQMRSDFGTPGYGGPCPPMGDKPHQYVFTAYALKIRHLNIPGDATAVQVGAKIRDNALAQASFTASYGR